MKKINVFLAGDSTMADYEASRAPQAGWGQMLSHFFNDTVVIENHAVNGRSSKSFLDEGRLAIIQDRMGAGDYLFIQFGHNDQKPDEARRTCPFTSYQEYLLKYIEVARNSRGTPVLITPVQRRKFNDDGTLCETHGDFPLAMKQLANSQNVPLIDLTLLSSKMMERLGQEDSKKLFMWLAPGVTTNFPDGVQDDTHFNGQGAQLVAELIAYSIRNSHLPLAAYLKK
ncbi:rhamnogalacturonan acetylesterase RhgT [Thalassobacillus devorans]|uniref:Rhamnogalacturonan acetylesterase RhgT n=1 Tax=Thalassobacillus devorans TaxID=279813 RepID=A0ABQ1NVU8_9BACI|nr:rhamnogalacturonan acetylesterase [Thalassobacillus devorans]NIK28735.1 lysophospholipase L1-like esterase [Thalassobacillus devorans]GGC83968.1 rhamnogalacturonan acetylesterase RhgT [Thalassobacillus devorans]